MSVGDIVLLGGPGHWAGWICANFGWKALDEEALSDAARIAQRRAYGTINTAVLPSVGG